MRTVRAECLDHVLVYGWRHLDAVLRACVTHYIKERPHRGLALATPLGRVVPVRPSISTVERRSVLGGLIQGYRWAA